MSTVLTGTAADPTTSPTATAPADGDTGNAASVNGALQALLNDISWLRTHIAQVDNTNTFTQAQTLQALLTLAAAGAVSLSRSGDQTILKGGSGKLQIGTSIATDLELWVNGAAKAVLSASTGRLGGLTDPASAQDAVTMGWATTRGARAFGLLTIGAAGAVTVANSFGISSASWSTSSLTVNYSPSLPTTTIAIASYGANPGGLLSAGSDNLHAYINQYASGGGGLNFGVNQQIALVVYSP